jgi:pimeloyl-ACP methyl ester carboxylesterase
LAAKGFFVIAPDYRGAGGSTVTEGGYDKWTMAGDIHALYRGLGKRSAIIVGTDIGSMVATALALRFRDSVDALCASGVCRLCQADARMPSAGNVSF